jgi:hypothetical protein
LCYSIKALHYNTSKNVAATDSKPTTVFGEAPIAPLEAFVVPEVLDAVGEVVVEDVTKDAVAAAVAEEDTDEVLGTAFA